MLHTKRESQSDKFADLLKIPWIKSSLYLGIGIVIIGLVLILLLNSLDIKNMAFFSDVQKFVKETGLLGIFLATILAGTLVPLGSPALVAAAALFGINPLLLTLVSTIGFTIGMVVNFALAYFLGRPYVTKKISDEKLEETTVLWNRWGWIIYVIFGLIPVLPVELLAFLCGVLKTRFTVFLILSFLPRFIVFALLAYFGETVGSWMGII